MARSEREEEFESRSGEDVVKESSSAPVEDEPNKRRGGSLSWLAQAFRRKSKEELEAEAEQKGEDLFEVCLSYLESSSIQGRTFDCCLQISSHEVNLQCNNGSRYCRSQAIQV